VSQIQVSVNGDAIELPEGASVKALLEQLKIATPRVAVERNKEIVPKVEYATTMLVPGDSLEVVEFVGGG
jgi:sulfur carrier protein